MHIKKMNKKILALTIAASFTLLGCEQPINSQQADIPAAEQLKILHSATQIDVDNIAENLQVKYRLNTNIPSEHCDSAIENGTCYEAELSFNASTIINAKDWFIYFSHIAPIQSFESDEFSIEHINGDLHRISLQNGFSGFKAGEIKTVSFRAQFWMLAESDAMPNYIVSAQNLKPRVIESTIPVIDPETGLETLIHIELANDLDKHFKRTVNDNTVRLTSENLFERNAAANLTSEKNKIAVTNAIIPTPKSVTIDAKNAFLNIDQGLAIHLGNVDKAQVASALSRLTALGIAENKQGLPLHLSISENKDKLLGSYSLNITDKDIKIVGVDANGVFNGIQSLASLVTLGETRLPLLNVDDEPHYTFRGMMVDVARNFHSKEFILSLLDQMAAYKLNKLHLHLGDDEGWRLEIPSLPELTEVGSKRCFDIQETSCLMPQLGAGVDPTSSVNGYYSVADYQEILAAATARHIQVIPSLDMPGHSRSSVKAMNARYKKYQALEDETKAKQFLLDDFEDTTKYSSVQFYGDNTINVCLESSYDFITEVMKQVKQMHNDAGQPLTRYHIGADETAGAWIDSPACQQFIANNDKGVTSMKELSAYFIERVASILSDLDIETAGWSDGMEHTRKENMPAIVQANAWDALFWGGHDKVHALTNRNWQMVLSSPEVLYFDQPYEADPKEHGYYWASRATNTEKIFQFMPDNLPAHAEFWTNREGNAYIADDTKVPLAPGQKFYGIQGQLWGENTRTGAMGEHKIYPRLLALAERAWYSASWAVPYDYQGKKYSQETNNFTDEMQVSRDNAWALFANVLGQKEFEKLELANIDYRLPTVGAVIKDGKLFANVAFPGLTIEYKVGNGDWLTYVEPVVVKGPVMVRSRSINGLRASRTTIALSK
ncbi:carbohydate-binding domain-containing protein [Colwellia sp. D2M02]|nr:carbohydate-binding domain-containing protein [Colwellia sp. D2M02]